MQAAATIKMTNLENIKGAIAAKIDSASFTSWIAPLNFEIVDDVLVLGAQNQFSADFINSVHGGVLSDVAATFGLKTRVVVRNASWNNSQRIANDNNTQVYAPATEPKQGVEFDSFVAKHAGVWRLSRRVCINKRSDDLFLEGGAHIDHFVQYTNLIGGTARRARQLYLRVVHNERYPHNLVAFLRQKMRSDGAVYPAAHSKQNLCHVAFLSFFI